jgi:competence protein ComEA
MQGFDFDELLFKYRYPLLIFLGGLILLGFGIIYFKNGGSKNSPKVEVLSGTTEVSDKKEITVEIAGEVIKPGVYKLQDGDRIEDLLTLAGGISGGADRTWTDKYLNRAAKLTDGQKVYIPKVGEQKSGTSAKSSGGDQTTSPSISSDSNSLININTASLKELDYLPGIGPTYGQSIIDHRPYSDTSELVSKGAVKQSLYEKIKNMVSVY